MMTLSEELLWRGQIKDKTFDDAAWLDDPKIFYLGSDCSSDSLTIGNLAVYMLARRLRKAGWRAVLLVGGATSLIGDPGGKDSERQLKSREEIEANVEGIKQQVVRLFDGLDFTLVNNYDWFKEIGYLEFLRDVGKHYSMTELLQRDFIAQRLGEGADGISYAEFSYSLIQGYDYWHLYTHHDVVLQIGGSDQWGNMLSGVPLIRKKESVEVHALSMPLVINKSTGKKFGKSEDGAVWLDEKKTSVYKFYQFWINADDEGVEDYLKIYTELDKQTIDELVAKHTAQPHLRAAQKRLAFEITKIVHGEERAKSAERVTNVLFGGASYDDLSSEDVGLLREELPVFETDGDVSLYEVLTATGLATSSSEARRLHGEGAVYLNGTQCSADTTLVTSDNLTKGFALIRRGKNQTALVVQKGAHHA